MHYTDPSAAQCSILKASLKMQYTTKSEKQMQ